MSQPNATDCIFEHILGFMLPFYLAAAGGDAKLAREAIFELVEAYGCATAVELEIAGRILGFSTVAMDNLRLSMEPEMSDAQDPAVSLERGGTQPGGRAVQEDPGGDAGQAEAGGQADGGAAALDCPAPQVRTEKPRTPATAKEPLAAVGWRAAVAGGPGGHAAGRKCDAGRDSPMVDWLINRPLHSRLFRTGRAARAPPKSEQATTAHQRSAAA